MPTYEEIEADRAQADRLATPAGLRTLLLECVAEYTHNEISSLRTDVLLSRYGLDSVYALALSAEIEDRLGVALEATVLWDNPTIDTLADALADRLGRPAPVAGA